MDAPNTAHDTLAPFRILVGIDWADQKHDVCWSANGQQSVHYHQVDHTPEALQEWIAQLRSKAEGEPIAVCVELRRGPLITFLMKYDFITIFPLPPAKLASYREAVQTTSGAKDDPTDANLILDYLRSHAKRLKAWKPEDELTREIACLSEQRRQVVDQRTGLANQLRSTLKEYFPQALDFLGGKLTTGLACEFLSRWDTLEELQRENPQTVRQFYHEQHCRREDTVEKRMNLLAHATPLTNDKVIIHCGQRKVQMLVAQIQVLCNTICEIEDRLQELVKRHPDRNIFDSFPSAGEALVPRLIAAFGTDRNKMDNASEIQSLSGVAPVTKKSGKKQIVRRRFACPRFLLQTFHEYANCSRKKSAWAAAFYDMKRNGGMEHHETIRCLAYKWIRIFFRCWKTQTPYDENQYLEQLRKRNAPLLAYLAS